MLPASARLRRSSDFTRVVRAGVRAGRPTVVVHAVAGSGEQSRAGFVVSKAVGGAVQRNRVKRRLRELCVPCLAGSDQVVDVVVRALPAAVATPERVPADLTSAWASAVRKVAA